MFWNKNISWVGEFNSTWVYGPYTLVNKLTMRVSREARPDFGYIESTRPWGFPAELSWTVTGIQYSEETYYDKKSYILQLDSDEVDILDSLDVALYKSAIENFITRIAEGLAQDGWTFKSAKKLGGRLWDLRTPPWNQTLVFLRLEDGCFYLIPPDFLPHSGPFDPNRPKLDQYGVPPLLFPNLPVRRAVIDEQTASEGQRLGQQYFASKDT